MHWIVAMQKKMRIIWRYKAFATGMFDKVQQWIKIIRDIEQSNWFVVQPNLCPGRDLEQFIEGTIAAGERDKAICQVSHQCLAFVHALHLVQLRQVSMGDLAPE